MLLFQPQNLSLSLSSRKQIHLSGDLGFRLANFDGRFSLVSCVLGVVVSNTSPRDVTEAVNGSL